MNRKEIEQAVAHCSARDKEQLLADKEFTSFLRYFPAGIGDDVKDYFNLWRCKNLVSGRKKHLVICVSNKRKIEVRCSLLTG